MRLRFLASLIDGIVAILALAAMGACVYAVASFLGREQKLRRAQ